MSQAFLSNRRETGPRGGFEIESEPGSNLGVTLWGDLGLGWFGRLATALARRGISIRSANSMRQIDESWVGRIRLSIENAREDPLALDYVALCEEPSADACDMPILNEFRIERTETNSLKLRIFAPDRLGLLSVLCERMGFFGLFPERLQVTTQDGFVDDTMWLRGVAGYAPSTEAERAIRDLLTKCVALDRTSSA